VGENRPTAQLESDCLRLAWRTQKSDRFGERSLQKFVSAPLPVLHALAATTPTSYAEFVAQVRRVCPLLSAHSFRRGAATLLSHAFPESDIVLLTGHAATQPVSRALRSYIDLSTSQLGPQRMLEMSAWLWAQIVAESRLADVELSPPTPSATPNSSTNPILELTPMLRQTA
jgi:integrase